MTAPETPREAGGADVRLPGIGAMGVLAVLGESDQPLTAKQIGEWLFADNFSARTRSASVAQNAWDLIRRGLAKRTLKRRELYVYSITDAGRALIARVEGRQP